MGYAIKSGRKLLKTDTFTNFTNNGQHRSGYARKKKTKKTQKVQYADDDNHPDQPNAIGNSGIVLYGHDRGYALIQNKQDEYQGNTKKAK